MSAFEEYKQEVEQSAEEIPKVQTAPLIEALGTISTVRIRELLGELTTEVDRLMQQTHTAMDTIQLVEQKTKEGVKQLLRATADTVSDYALGAQAHGLVTQEKAEAPFVPLDEVCQADKGVFTAMTTTVTVMRQACDEIDIIPHELTGYVEKSQEYGSTAYTAAQRYVQDIKTGGDR